MMSGRFRSLVFSLALAGVFFGFVPGLSLPEAEASWFQRLRDAIQRALDRYESGQGAQGVPELDPSAAGQAVVLVAGGAYLIARRRRAQP